jgi:hypothetical protein
LWLAAFQHRNFLNLCHLKSTNVVTDLASVAELFRFFRLIFFLF